MINSARAFANCNLSSFFLGSQEQIFFFIFFRFFVVILELLQQRQECISCVCEDAFHAFVRTSMHLAGQLDATQFKLFSRRMQECSIQLPNHPKVHRISVSASTRAENF